jgi:D-glycero-D-manno-heptose 1,7-bisphosphate phosphatase
MKGLSRAVFLDRDGVVNDLALNNSTGAWESPHRPSETVLLPTAARSIAELRRAGWSVLVVSNQPSAAKKKCTLDDLALVHSRIVALLAEAGAEACGYYYCHHHPEGADPALRASCACRKPSPGLLLRASAERGIDLSRSWMIGDRDSDIECGRRAGCRTILARHPKTPSDPERCKPHYLVQDLCAAAEIILTEAHEPCRS